MNGELKAVVYNREGDALKRIQAKLMQAGASLPATEAKGTPESAINTGLSIALLLVEGELINLDDTTPAPGALPELPSLPKPDASYRMITACEAQLVFRKGSDAGIGDDFFSAAKMHAYARAYAEECRAGVDRSKEVCAFESWALAQGFHPDDFDRIEGRPANKFGLTWEYNGNFLQASWAAWMERAALQSAFADDEGVKS